MNIFLYKYPQLCSGYESSVLLGKIVSYYYSFQTYKPFSEVFQLGTMVYLCYFVATRQRMLTTQRGNMCTTFIYKSRVKYL